MADDVKSPQQPPEQLTWPMAAMLIGLIFFACIFVLGMNALPLLAVCR